MTAFPPDLSSSVGSARHLFHARAAIRVKDQLRFWSRQKNGTPDTEPKRVGMRKVHHKSSWMSIHFVKRKELHKKIIERIDN